MLGRASDVHWYVVLNQINASSLDAGFEFET